MLKYNMHMLVWKQSANNALEIIMEVREKCGGESRIVRLNLRGFLLNSQKLKIRKINIYFIPMYG